MTDVDTLIDREARSARYYRNAVERHWDPAEIDLSRDRAALLEADEAALAG